jgi:hypothetical protein
MKSILQMLRRLFGGNSQPMTEKYLGGDLTSFDALYQETVNEFKAREKDLDFKNPVHLIERQNIVMECIESFQRKCEERKSQIKVDTSTLAGMADRMGLDGEINAYVIKLTMKMTNW